MKKQDYENKMSYGEKNKDHPDAIIEDIVKNMATPPFIREYTNEWWRNVVLDHGDSQKQMGKRRGK